MPGLGLLNKQQYEIIQDRITNLLARQRSFLRQALTLRSEAAGLEQRAADMEVEIKIFTEHLSKKLTAYEKDHATKAAIPQDGGLSS